MSPVPTRPGPRRAPWFRAGCALGVLVLAWLFFSPARELVDPRLDPSNYASYAFFTSRGFQYGPEVMPLAGPYGFVPYGFLYAGQLYWKRLPLELLTKLVLGGLVLWLGLRAGRRPILLAGWLATTVLMMPFVEDLPYDLAVLLAGLALADVHPRPERRHLLFGCLLAAYLALLTLFKGTQAMLAVAALGLVALQAIAQRDFRRLPWLGGSYLLTLLALLLLAGQNPLHFPIYLGGMFELSAGYNLAMGLDESPTVFATGLVTLLALEFLTLLRGWELRRDVAGAAGALLLAGFHFIQWKHGFVRADGHVLIFFHYACVAAFAVLLWGGASPAPSRVRQGVGWGLALLAVVAGAWSGGAAPWGRHTWSLHLLAERLPAGARQIWSPARAKRELDHALDVQRARFDLALTRERVGGASIDFFGTDLGFLLLNRFNYRPRPMGGGTFSVFSAGLQQRNAEYAGNPQTRPAFFLVSPVTIDHRLLTQDDPGTLRALWSSYQPVAAELGMVLFQSRPDAAAPAAPRPILSRPFRFDQPVEVPPVGPEEVVLVTLQMPFSLAGRLRSFLYKAPVAFLDLEGDGLVNPQGRRVVPSLFQVPVPLSPVVENTTDLLRLYDDVPGKRVRRLTLRCARPGLWQDEAMTIRFFAAPKPTRGAGETARDLIRGLDFPFANVLPREMLPRPFPPRQFDGLPVQMLEAPGLIRFDLEGSERELDFKYGIDAQAYESGATDGVDFLVEVERPGQPAQIVFRRLLKPRTVPADRGTQSARVVLPPLPEGAHLVLRTDMGPDRDGAWDWGYYTAIRFQRGPLRREQFPGFNRTPDTVIARNAGIIPSGGRDLFMVTPTGTLAFTLQGTETRLEFDAGLLPGSYTGGGETDGVSAVVTLERADGTRRILLERHLNPRDQPADRGDQDCRVRIPPGERGSRLLVTITPGPQGNESWDWSYLSRLQLE